MCPHRKTVYECNHSVTSSSPIRPCLAQQDYLAGLNPEPCQLEETHGRSTVRVPRLCSSCQDKKLNTDERFALAKTRMAELRRHLEDTYEQCMSHLDEVGVRHEGRTLSSTATAATATTESGEGGKSGEDAGKASSSSTAEKLDPAQEFLRKKNEEKYAHLMMYSDFR
ncbi:hypothetical protein GGR54DRAFT_596115 [Hypoxylon sp. NC1633]|nr:hypothetical protein GGR54DRAFT_596115 [Hypoxylon sp. NC1633]